MGGWPQQTFPSPILHLPIRATTPPSVRHLVTDSLPLPPIELSRIQFHSMSQPTKFSSTPSTLAGTKAGNEGGSPSTSRRAVSIAIAIEGEGGLAYVQKMMAQGGPARTGGTLKHVTNNHDHLPLPMAVNPFPICPSPASGIQKHDPFLFASQLVEHYSSTQSHIPAATKTPVIEAVTPQEKEQSA